MYPEPCKIAAAKVKETWFFKRGINTETTCRKRSRILPEQDI
jgi:hypothetical protein